jgi:Ni,Fe-hydrogenase I large subunit
MQKKVKNFVEAGQLGIFAKAYWGHPAYKLPPEANLMAVAHYLEALAWQRDVAKLHTIFRFMYPIRSRSQASTKTGARRERASATS